jgi:ABC-type glutathione transport system ATPase component
MQVRLAFSIAIRAKSDILLLDEVLAVGDAIFQKKCYDYFKQLKREGKTVIFVSHDVGALQEYCTNGILLERSEVIKTDIIDKVVKGYLDVLNKTEKNQTENSPTNQQRWGSGQVVITAITVGDMNGPTKIFRDNESITIAVTFKAKQDVESPVFGITVNSLTGQIVFQSNTLWCQKPVSDMHQDGTATCYFTIPNVFNTGTYLVSPAVSSRDGVTVYDWREDMVRFKITKQQKSHGVINVQHQLEVEQ